ncbi:hypothetical protein [Streptomyces iconiensis]|uniref:Uncharacterized protein n=1 Tax=Streptomyces iconiensis TaxID=1384038 RepID=A0ABT7A601_9ACTN|nr:hypothetical protein [Streptomyces iconiensis]MDJ1136449.1 hypothetical protein [Streptomyces iconiensis]
MSAEPQSPSGQEQPPRHDSVSALVFDDPLGRQSSDDTDRGWGEGARTGSGGGDADLARFLDEKPPHHI